MSEESSATQGIGTLADQLKGTENIVVSQAVSSEAVVATELPEGTISAATLWMLNRGLTLEDLTALPPRERAARLTQAVYSFCNTSTQTGDMQSLFTTCTTFCGGYSYVLRGLLEATGLQTRYAHLNNIPSQGNHTAVEVIIDGDWAFFDPTFGVYFTEDGTVNGRPLALSEIVLKKNAEALEQAVLQSPKAKLDFMKLPLEDLYDEKFEHEYMELQNYLVAEAVNHNDPRELLILEVDLKAQNGEASIGDFSANSQSDMSTAWLNQTNQILLNDDLQDDISYNAGLLYSSSINSLTLIRVSGLEPNAPYTIKLLFWNGRSAPMGVQVSPVGRSARLGADPMFQIGPNKSVYVAPFRAQEPVVQFAVRNVGDTSLLYLFGVEVTQVEK